MYFNPNAKWYSFTYKKTPYSSGTKLIYNGRCHLAEQEIVLNNQVVTYLYDQYSKTYFQDNNNTYTCNTWEFTSRIVKIVVDEEPLLHRNEPVFYWTDEMVVKTIWYIVIMLIAILFKDCIAIWVFATITWYNSVLKKKK